MILFNVKLAFLISFFYYYYAYTARVTSRWYVVYNFKMADVWTKFKIEQNKKCSWDGESKVRVHGPFQLQSGSHYFRSHAMLSMPALGAASLTSRNSPMKLYSNKTSPASLAEPFHYQERGVLVHCGRFSFVCRFISFRWILWIISAIRGEFFIILR